MESGKTKQKAASALDIVSNKARLLDTLPDCVLLVGCDLTVLAANATAGTMFGIDSGKVIGKPLKSALSSLVNDDNSQLDLRAAVERALSSGDAERLDAWYSNGNRSDSDLSKVSITVLPETSGDAAAVVVSGDSSMHPYGLRDAVLSMVSHELRTPLLHIKGFVSSLLESDIEWDEETRLEFLHTIDREADRLTSMVSDLMEITRMGSGDLPLHLEYVDPHILAYTAVDESSPFTRRHRVVVNVPEDLPGIRIDVLRVTGVLVNLLENATKYSEEGSTITVDAKSDGTEVVFSVSDEGPGIEKDVHSKIFNMFFRGPNERKKSSGTGLGLAVCKAVTNAHQGDIWVESELGVGSTFKFNIPVNKGRRRVSKKSKPRAKQARARVNAPGSAKDSAKPVKRAS